MEIPHSITSQKTSFWDFWHKKIYQNRKEKDIDFVLGSIGFLFLLLFPYDAFNDWRQYGFVFPVGFFLLYLLVLVFMFRKRKYIAKGMAVAFIIWTFFFIFLSPVLFD